MLLPMLCWHSNTLLACVAAVALMLALVELLQCTAGALGSGPLNMLTRMRYTHKHGLDCMCRTDWRLAALQSHTFLSCAALCPCACHSQHDKLQQGFTGCRVAPPPTLTAFCRRVANLFQAVASSLH